MNLQIQDPKLRQAAQEIATLVTNQGGRALLVGGSIRDSLFGAPLKDLDIEVYGIAPADLKALLESRFALDLVGAAFGVLKLKGLPIDVSIPRHESKSGFGHKGFEVLSDPTMSPREAAFRRDFTINAMGLDLHSNELHDHFGGQRDLHDRILRHTSEKFREDPLRVLRGMQFAARFDLRAAPETVALCNTMGPEGLAAERIFEEWRKLILRGRTPSLGLNFLRDTGWLQHFPELAATVDCAQDPDWHPEGDVWIHTLQSMDAFADDRIGDDHEDLVVGLAVLCHDLGKPLTTEIVDGRLRSIGHCERGEAPTRAFLARMINQRELVHGVVALVRNHLRPGELHAANAGDGAIRRLARRVVRIDRLVRVATADKKGVGHRRATNFPAADWLLKRAQELQVRDSAPKPIVQGRHLIDLGLEPGPIFGPILETCFEAQIDGSFADLDGGIDFARRLVRQCAD